MFSHKGHIKENYMDDSTNQFQRLAIISELARRVPEGFGRTALMKYLFFS